MKRILFVFMVLLLSILVACSNSEEDTSTESKEEIIDEDGEQVANEEASSSEIPDIDDNAMNHAYDIINGYDMVNDSYIEVSKEDNKITLAIQVNSATNEEHAKELGDNFVRGLASGAAVYSEDELESPSKDYLGEVYDYYDVHIGVGSGPDNFIVQGAKVTSSPKITW